MTGVTGGADLRWCRGVALEVVTSLGLFTGCEPTHLRKTRKSLSHNEILDLSRVQHARAEGTSQTKDTSWSTELSFSADGTGVVAHAGALPPVCWPT